MRIGLVVRTRQKVHGQSQQYAHHASLGIFFSAVDGIARLIDDNLAVLVFQSGTLLGYELISSWRSFQFIFQTQHF
jgi:hypothetical protein